MLSSRSRAYARRMVKMMLLLMVAVAACKSHQPHQSGASAPCDSRVEERQRWLTTPQEAYKGQKPSDGLRVLGSCTDTVVAFQPSCDKGKLRGVAGDSPHLHDALALGFKTYVCELASDHSLTEYPLADVLTKRANDPRPIVPATDLDQITLQEAIAKVEGFKDDMCKCKAGDKVCAEQVEQAMRNFADSMKDKERDLRPSEADEKRMMEIVMQMAKCQQAAMGTDDMGAP